MRAEERSARGRLAGAQHHAAGSAPPLRGTQRAAGQREVHTSHNLRPLDFARALAARARLRRQSRGLCARRTYYPNANRPPPRAADSIIDRAAARDGGLTGGGIALARRCASARRAARGAKQAATRGTRPQGAGCRGAHASRRADP